MIVRAALLVLALAAALWLVMILIGSDAFGQGLCGKRAEILATLESRFGEVPVAMGIVTQSNNLLEIVASEKEQTWTIIVTYTGSESRTCVVSSGEAWRMLPWARKRTPI